MLSNCIRHLRYVSFESACIHSIGNKISKACARVKNLKTFFATLYKRRFFKKVTVKRDKNTNCDYLIENKIDKEV